MKTCCNVDAEPFRADPTNSGLHGGLYLILRHIFIDVITFII